jgi:two-component system CheB/CheR fusion protein
VKSGSTFCPMKRKKKLATQRGSQDLVFPAGPKSFPIVGVGASAGGLEAFTQLLKHLPVDTGMGFVLVQYLDPAHESALASILGKATLMPVREVSNDMRIQPNHVYVIPPNANLTVADGVLKLQPRSQNRGARRSIDFFFESLAAQQREQAIGVILSGTATDGTLGLEAIKAEGGIAFAQDASAKCDSMPHSAVVAGCVDFVLSPEKIAKELARIAKHPYIAGTSLGNGPPHSRSSRPQAEANAKQNPSISAAEIDFRGILLLLRNHRGVDFSLYKPKTIQRRVSRRMVLNKQNDLGRYAGFLKGNAIELDALYSDMLISVTGFFRNSEAFESLKRKVFPELLQQERRRDEPVRAWVLGCSTGQEAYSIAMAFAEFCEPRESAPRLQIFATDLNEAVLNKARAGFYTKSLVADMSPDRLRRFFVEEQGGYRITKSLREGVIFARQNVLSDPPFSRMDLISCRNLLIYIEPKFQKKIMPAFHYALKPKGFLFLGASESIGSFSELFEPIDKKQKIFLKSNVPTPRSHRPVSKTPSVAKEESPALRAPQILDAGSNAQREADRLALTLFAPPGVLINADFQILQFRGPTGTFLQPPTGKPSFNLLKMAREGLVLPLRAVINQAKKENQRVKKENVPFKQIGGPRLVNLEVIPLLNLKERFYLVLFEDVRQHPVHEPDPPAGANGSKLSDAKSARIPRPAVQSKRLAAALRRNAELDRELTEARNYLQSIQDQTEAAHEELQASSEEMQSGNEELQSINEELETSKEELESTNEELLTVNEEMVSRNQELARLNSDLLNLQNSINTAVVLLDRNLAIRRFTPLAEKAFNILATDIGRSIRGLRVNFEFKDLADWIGEVLRTVTVKEQEVQDEEGRWYSLRALPYMTLDNKIDGAVLMLVDIDAVKRAEKKALDAKHYAEAILEEAPPLLILSEDLKVISGNVSFYKHFKVSPAETENCLVYDLGNKQWNIPKLQTFLEQIVPRNSFFKDFEVIHTFEDLGPRTMLLNACRLDGLHQILLFIDDITERVQSQERVRASELRYRQLFDGAIDGILVLDPETRKITEANPAMASLLGYPLGEFVGKELWQIGLIENASAMQRAFGELQERGIIRYETLPMQTRAGRTIQVEFVGNFYRENETLRIQCSIRDITERKQVEQSLEEAREKIAQHAGVLQMEVAERTADLQASMRSLEALTYTMAHDLRSPIRAMTGLTSAMLEDVPLNESGKNYAERIHQAAGRMDQLINDLLDFGQLTHLEFPIQPVDLKSRTQKVLAEIGKDIRTTNADIQVQDPLPVIRGNGTLVDQVLSNLILNALKFVAPGVAPKVLFRAESQGSMVRFWVEDNGIGIAADHQDKIFGIFQRLHNTEEFPGTGVGLAIAKRAVERMVGQMGVESALGKGSRFWFELPKS